MVNTAAWSFRGKHPEIQFELELSAEAQDLSAGRFNAAIRNGHGRWPGLRAIKLFPSIFMPLCAPARKDAAAGLLQPHRPLGVPLLGRADWWALWYLALGMEDVPLLASIGTNLSAEYLDIAQAVAGHGIAIGSPILFKNEIDAGRLVPAHDLVTGDGRAFWFTFPVVRQHSTKIVRFSEWLCEEAVRACEAGGDDSGGRGWGEGPSSSISMIHPGDLTSSKYMSCTMRPSSRM